MPAPPRPSTPRRPSPVPGRLRGGLLVGALALAGCASTLQPGELRGEVTEALPADPGGELGRIFHSAETSRFTGVDRGDEAYDLRLALISNARTSIDVQSYLWHGDPCGALLLDRLLEAADRGVRVRVLIDGFKLEGHEDLGRRLDRHPDLELRVFNPTLHRGGVWRALEIVEHLDRLDHRMHNKLLLVDGVAAVFGGRNVGDEYFGLGDESDLRDFDLLASGPVVGEMARVFDGYWNGDWTVSLARLSDGPVDPAEVEAARRAVRDAHGADPRLHHRRATSAEDWRRALERARAHMLPGHAEVWFDDVHVEHAGATGVVAHAFERALGASHGDTLIVTAYLVPDPTVLDCVRAHVAAGERVRILTNSRATNNQPLAHEYYARARRELLEAGAELYELRGDAFSHVYHRSPGSRAAKLGLHAKCAVLGPDLLLVGSMNLDPRSMRLNTEFGVLVHSPELAARARGVVERELAPRNAWRVTLRENGRLRWESQGVVLDEEPDPPEGQHLRDWFLSLLPLRGEV